jgi:broad specificity phosphatase PhoE
MPRLFVVRHGNTFDAGEVVRRVGGRTDLALSVSGRAQASALAAHFASTRFVAAASSPLQRTRATARAILAARTDAPALILVPFLREIDYGPDENQPEAEVEARLGRDALEAWEKDGVLPAGWHADTGAIRQGWRGLIDRCAMLNGGANVLVVTSSGIARFLPGVLQGTPDDLDPKLKTGAWGEIIIENGRAGLAAWNRRP